MTDLLTLGHAIRGKPRLEAAQKMHERKREITETEKEREIRRIRTCMPSTLSEVFPSTIGGGQKKPKVNERPDFFPSCPHRSHGSVCRHLEQAEEERGRKTAELIDTLLLFFFFSVSVCEFSAHLSLPDHKTVCGRGGKF